MGGPADELKAILKQKLEREKKENQAFINEVIREAFKAGVVINGSVKVEQFKELLEKVSFKFPEEFRVSNLSEIAKYIEIPGTEFPKEFRISNLSDIEIPEQKDVVFPKEFRISNLEEIKQEKFEIPENLSKLSFEKSEGLLDILVTRFDKFVKNFKNEVWVKNREDKDAIPVNIVKGLKFTKSGKLEVEVDRTGGGGGLTSSESNKLLTLATEEKQDDIIGAIGDIQNNGLTDDELRANPVVVSLDGGATEGKQDSQIDLQETLASLAESILELSQRLAFLGSIRHQNNSLKVTPMTSVSTPVTGSLTSAGTVSSVGTLTNFGTGIPASEVAHDVNNQLATLANINNVTP
jgi:hypothetical protein